MFVRFVKEFVSLVCYALPFFEKIPKLARPFPGNLFWLLLRGFFCKIFFFSPFPKEKNNLLLADFAPHCNEKSDQLSVLVLFSLRS